MADTQKNIINAEEMGYMSYNKLNVFMTTLLLGFSITFAILGDRVNISNPFTSMGDWDWRTIGIVFGTIGIVFVIILAGISNFKFISSVKSTYATIIALFIIGIILYMFWVQWILVIVIVCIIGLIAKFAPGLIPGLIRLTVRAIKIPLNHPKKSIVIITLVAAFIWFYIFLYSFYKSVGK